jgi:hypothetical protein
MRKPFKLLSIFAEIHIVIGLLLMIAGLGIAALTLFGPNRDPEFLTSALGIGITLGFFIGGLAVASYGEFIQVVICIEANTRALIKAAPVEGVQP